MKQFHVYNDRKTVTQLSWNAYMKLQSRKGFMVGWITDCDILFVKGSSIICLSLEQLNKILELNRKEAKP